MHRIEDYGFVGDCRSGALISRSGSVDWLCFPRFDSPSLFAALLDERAGGLLRIAPSARTLGSQRYVAGTNVLETTFETATGTVLIRDAMPVVSEADKRRLVLPQHELLREVEGLSGAVELAIEYEPRPNYGRARPRIERRGACGLWATDGRAAFILTSDMPFNAGCDGTQASAVASIEAGERKYVSLSYTQDAPAVIPALGQHARERMQRSVDWWRSWISTCMYDGRYQEHVLRSVLALKLLTYAPSGAVIAAPTTSLPEQIGGARNWDYRFSWLRDASLTIRVFLELGYEEEARAFCSWLLHSTRLSWPELQVVYDVFGGTHLRERQLDHLDGYHGSRPVRVGNGAFDQLQLDVYGELIEAVSRYLEHDGKRLDRETRKMLKGLGDTVCHRWSEPDEGIWETREGRFHHTHSKVMCWVALDRLLALHERGLIDVPVDTFRRVRDDIRAEIESRGFNSEIGSYTRVFDGDEADGALLLLPQYGYLPGSSPHMSSTIDHILADLGEGPFVHRYRPGDDGLTGGEGAFGVVSFWAVEALAAAGALEQARDRFEALLGHATPLGLYAEEFEPADGTPLGNFPQAFTHVGLINAALAIDTCEREKKA